MANALARKGTAKNVIYAPERVCPENRVCVIQNRTPVRNWVAKNAAPISNDIVRSLKINAANTRHRKTMAIEKKQCTYSKFWLFDASINQKYSTCIYKLNDYTLDKIKNTINKLQHDKFFVKFKAWDKLFEEAKHMDNKYCSYDHYVEKYGNLQNLNCLLCDNEFENAQHLFTKCAKTMEFRKQLLDKAKRLLKECIWQSTNDNFDTEGYIYHKIELKRKNRKEKWNLRKR